MDFAIIIPLALIAILQLGANICKKQETGYINDRYEERQEQTNFKN